MLTEYNIKCDLEYIEELYLILGAIYFHKASNFDAIKEITGFDDTNLNFFLKQFTVGVHSYIQATPVKRIPGPTDYRNFLFELLPAGVRCLDQIRDKMIFDSFLNDGKKNKKKA